MFSMDELIAMAAALITETDTGYRLTIPCALYIDASTREDVRERLMETFGGGEARTLDSEHGVVLYPGYGSQEPGVEDVGDDYKTT
jgi:hypothetical protein